MIGFIYKLIEAGIPVSVRYIIELYGALQNGIVSNLDQLFLLTRLIFVKRLEHYDLFEQVFSSFFLGKDSAKGMPDWEELLAGKPFQDWLRDEIARGALSPEAIRIYPMEDLLARFWETVLAQRGEHHGGETWVGTHGRSPYGHSGQHGGGIRVHGRGLYGTAQKVIDQRRYVSYSGESVLARENLQQVLASLKSLRPMGPETELDVDETIARTAKNGGEIELVFRRELRSHLKLILLLDNGGYSMTPYVPLVKTVFNKVRSIFENVTYYYFHNCIYGTVYRDAPRTQPVKWDRFIGESKATRLIVIGDANMAPAELMASYGSLDLFTSERKPGFEWLKELRNAFPASVWLNPIIKNRWGRESNSIFQIQRIFHMEDLTLNGIRNGVAHLNVQGQAFDGHAI